MIKVAVLLLAGIAIATAAEIPRAFHICNKSEPNYLNCIADSATRAIVSLANGLKPFRILPIEPLAVESVKIGESEGSVTLKQEYRNIKLYGLTKGLQISNYRINLDDKCELLSEAYNPQVEFVADYKINGRILVLPVTGNGKSNITMYDLKTETNIYCEKYQKKGETFIRVKDYVVKFSPGRVSLQFDNLFNGDTVLGDQMNKFINENSELLFKELQAPYEETFGLVFQKLSNDIFSRIPMNKLFPN
ncbi:protein takeout-like [Prorops nasuta]|uniref:protein takeout-like n=1 Tax=Prorops nasuta TaxID=863751 RepID=UPI0034CDAACD